MNKNIKNNISISNELLRDSPSYHFDFIRGTAAILVLLNHFRNIFFVPYAEVENQNIFSLLIYSFSGLGHEAVMVFFVLSGFFISNSVIKSLDKWSWKYYFVNRLTRLYIVLIPALLITLLLDFVGMYFFDYSFFPHNMSERINLDVFIGNILFLQGFETTVFGSNDPLWSLSYEFWYYLLFPFILLIFTKGTKTFLNYFTCF